MLNSKLLATLILLVTGIAIIAACSSCIQGVNSHAAAQDYTQTRHIYAGAPLDTPPLLQSDTITTRTRDTGKTPPTGKQVFGLWVGRFSAVALITLGALLFLCPSAVALFFVKRAMAFKNAFSETVAAIHNSNAVKDNTALHDALVNSQSPQTRELVATVKKDA